jgi:hypothetical protein
VTVALRPVAAQAAAAQSVAAQPVPDDGSLPRRSPGAQLTEHPLASPAPAPAARVDPEVVRARLSALAEGVSAALRRSNYPTTAVKDR